MTAAPHVAALMRATASLGRPLRYAAEYEDEGSEWPSLPETEDGEEEWMMTFHQSLAAALEAMG